jgi:peroxisomal membrane protein 4
VLQQVLRLTATHAFNLAAYVGLYKLLYYVLRSSACAAGAIAGAAVFGTSSTVNSQINLYVMARVLYALACKHTSLGTSTLQYRLFAALVWALVMHLFETQTQLLQASLVHSMTFLYQESKHWPSNIRDWFLLW